MTKFNKILNILDNNIMTSLKYWVNLSLPIRICINICWTIIQTNEHMKKRKVLQENILNTISSFFTVIGIKRILIRNRTNFDVLVILSSSWLAKYLFGVTSISNHMKYLLYKVNKMGSLWLVRGSVNTGSCGHITDNLMGIMSCYYGCKRKVNMSRGVASVWRWTARSRLITEVHEIFTEHYNQGGDW